MTLKQKIYNYFLQALQEKIRRLQTVLIELKEIGSNETKSTAGDKHETALAMLQIEQVNIHSQLNDLFEKKAVMKKINPDVISTTVINGSLVSTNRGYLFLSIASGKAIIEGVSVTALSSRSPLGARLMGLSTGGRAEVQNTAYIIESIT